MSNLQDELNSLPNDIATDLEKWFKEKIYKIRKGIQNERLNYVPYVKRRQVIWVDFGFSIGQEIKDAHPAIVLYSSDTSGTVVVIPLTTKENNADFVINIGAITGMDSNFSHAKVDQITCISKLRIQTKKNKSDGKYYNNFNKSTNQFNNPKVTTEQIQKIDDMLLKFKEKSEK